MVRACRSMPQYNGCWVVEKRLRSPPLERVMFPTLSIPSGYAGEGASISIKGVQATAASLVSL